MWKTMQVAGLWGWNQDFVHEICCILSGYKVLIYLWDWMRLPRNWMNIKA
jgi:hypothetical protein